MLSIKDMTRGHQPRLVIVENTPPCEKVISSKIFLPSSSSTTFIDEHSRIRDYNHPVRNIRFKKRFGISKLANRHELVHLRSGHRLNRDGIVSNRIGSRSGSSQSKDSAIFQMAVHLAEDGQDSPSTKVEFRSL